MKEVITELYDSILEGKTTRFPVNFWKDNNSLLFASICVRHLIEDILKWTDEDVKEKLNIYIFKQHKLYGMLSILFKCSPFLAYNNAYPNKLREWELSTTKRSFWTEDTKFEAIRWLIGEKLKLTKEQVCEIYEVDLIVKYLPDQFRNEGIFNLLDRAFPNTYKKYELKNWYRDTWTEKDLKEHLHNIFYVKLGYTKEEVSIMKLTGILKANKLDYVLHEHKIDYIKFLLLERL